MIVKYSYWFENQKMVPFINKITTNKLCQQVNYNCSRTKDEANIVFCNFQFGKLSVQLKIIGLDFSLKWLSHDQDTYQ